MENRQQMDKRHKEEIDRLKHSCKHRETKRMPFMWAPGHYGTDVEVCEFCGKIVKNYTERVEDGNTTCANAETP